MISRIAVVMVFALASSTLAASDPVVYRVEKARKDHVPRFQADGDRFVKAETVPSAMVVGGVIVEVSSRGYVLVATASGPVWLDKMDLQIHPKLPMKGKCLAGVSSAVDTTSGIVRGAGEGCQ